MTGREKYQQREEELSKLGYLAVLYLRHSLEQNPVETKQMCEKALSENLNTHGHSEYFDELCPMVEKDLLKLATKRFAYRIFDLPKIREEEKHKKQERKQKEFEEVQKRVQAFKNKKYIVKIKKSN